MILFTRIFSKTKQNNLTSSFKNIFVPEQITGYVEIPKTPVLNNDSNASYGS